MQALHFGAGNIGRGFIGKSLSESGFNVIFSDTNQNLVDSINYHKEYNIKIIGNQKENLIKIKNIHAINTCNAEITKIITQVDLITTAVGISSLEKIAGVIADGIKLKVKKKSFKILNIISCENKIKASSYLKKRILNILPLKYHNYLFEYIGFIDCSIDTIVPFSNLVQKNNLSIIAEDFREWIVDRSQFKGIVPKIVDMKLSDNLDFFINRKILTLNTGHAVAAYLGSIKKYKTIYESLLDLNIRKIVQNAMQESGNFLVKRFNCDQNNHLSYIKTIFSRFENPFLSDSLQRVARNPIQKLSKNERLIKPLLGATKYKTPCFNLIKGVSAAFHYKNKNDLESIKISSLIKKFGIKETIIKICDLNQDNKIIDLIVLEYHSILNNFL
ncbi:mannitol-1-phosphate 5-dehydrogenase [Buchnera aphidicola (Muscaphis stroyani)]|uniref:Mannitol-1-phosphate 5-dehydrogenase n=1 Tax=Buchnera aphidicola (Muscaphis stroyani) TaxID=1241869 RepID=A0A4D6YD96_9GAMM|nr:mannitol-1-phosphate 5-dehydrogenase [Buchnera aphidicola]QCI24601.1 mannitol-1-phosphate 5-dehydrogenase [Buchnera aphidicola (Muscaphis stroyani)]